MQFPSLNPPLPPPQLSPDKKQAEEESLEDTYVSSTLETVLFRASSIIAKKSERTAVKIGKNTACTLQHADWLSDVQLFKTDSYTNL